MKWKNHVPIITLALESPRRIKKTRASTVAPAPATLKKKKNIEKRSTDPEAAAPSRKVTRTTKTKRKRIKRSIKGKVDL